MEYKTFKIPPLDFDIKMEAAGCCCVYEDKLLICQRHPNAYQGSTWGIPGGKLDTGEAPMEAAIREIYEEVGIDMRGQEIVNLGSIYVRLPHLDYCFHVFYKDFLVLPQIHLKADENSDVCWATLEDCLTLPLITGAREVFELFKNYKRQM